MPSFFKFSKFRPIQPIPITSAFCSYSSLTAQLLPLWFIVWKRFLMRPVWHSWQFCVEIFLLDFSHFYSLSFWMPCMLFILLRYYELRILRIFKLNECFEISLQNWHLTFWATYFWCCLRFVWELVSLTWLPIRFSVKFLKP